MFYFGILQAEENDRLNNKRDLAIECVRLHESCVISRYILYHTYLCIDMYIDIMISRRYLEYKGKGLQIILQFVNEFNERLAFCILR